MDDESSHRPPEWAEHLERRVLRAISESEERIIGALRSGKAQNVTIHIHQATEEPQVMDISVDVQNEQASLKWEDKQGNVTTPPAGVVVTWASSDPSVTDVIVTADQDVADLKFGNVGPATVSASFADGSGNPVPKPDGTGNFDPVSVDLNLTAGQADQVLVSVEGAAPVPAPAPTP